MLCRGPVKVYYSIYYKSNASWTCAEFLPPLSQKRTIKKTNPEEEPGKEECLHTDSRKGNLCSHCESHCGAQYGGSS